MRTGRPKATITLSQDELDQLTAIVNSESTTAKLKTRARIVISAAMGESNLDIAERMQIASATVCKWRARFNVHRVAGLYDVPRSGAPRRIDYDNILLKMQQAAASGSNQSVRAIAVQTGASKSSVHRLVQRLTGTRPTVNAFGHEVISATMPTAPTVTTTEQSRVGA